MENAFTEVAFWTLSIVTVGGALGVVRTHNMFRAALLLVVSFVGVAGIFALVNAEFLAVVQLLVYAGGVAVLVIFAAMITTNVTEGNRSTGTQPFAVLVSLVLLSALVSAIVQAEWALLPDDMPAPLAAAFVDTPAALGRMLLNEFVLPFEIAGVVLLAAVIGALSLVRER
ncbi:MAG: NADH-quinone oxidoreductase subunit J [Chloroflexi bacterium]|nr:NADH-quinone oxidoreductase subunit J [Chloroflexota bacterium]MDA1173146.1 NADH-quinone oxidoreductase subunit J [Chloroflexota bacterium]MQC83286.1 NADH-quinone oxidoreductase subunit J [Chloroflexota bacterium]